MILKQLPEILTSASFWASIGTMWAASGAWFTYVAAASYSHRQTFEGVLNTIEGLEKELDLVREWVRSGGIGEEGYLLSKTRVQLVTEHPDWFNPSRMIFTFVAPTLTNLTNSPFAKSMGAVVSPMILLGHSIRRLFDYIHRYQAFVMGDSALFQSVMEKFAPKSAPTDLGSSTAPKTIIAVSPAMISWEPEERRYINHIFMMNEAIYQHLIGGVDSPDSNCLYKAFSIARGKLINFKTGLRQEPLPGWYWILHVVAGLLALNGAWQVLRWFDVWQRISALRF
jgi:hypothetical protein